MSHVVDFFTGRYGASGNVISGIVFISIAFLGLAIALRGRGAMIWLVSACGLIVGIISGAMIGLLVFDSFILMLVFGFLGGTALLLLVRFVKSVGYFIGIGALGFFLAFSITSEMHLTNTRITENTIMLADLMVGIIMGLLAAAKSKYIVTIITAASGGVIAAISILALLRCYFADWRTWLLAAAIAIGGLVVQVRVYDLAKRERKPEHVKKKYRKPQPKHAAQKRRE